MEMFKQRGNKKLYIAGGIVVFVVVASVFAMLHLNQVKASDMIKEYTQLLADEKYEDMYQLLSKETKENISKKAFVSRNQNIYEGIEASDIKIKDIEEKENKLTYTMSMNSIAGEFSFKNSVNCTKEEGEYKLEWDSSVIFPDLKDDGFVSVETDYGKRGMLLDRNEQVLATQADMMQVGLVPEYINDEVATLQNLSSLTGLSVEKIEEKLNASWVEKDMFVPIKNMAHDTSVFEALNTIEGVQINILKEEGRSYPYGEKCAHLTGYVQSITAEELEKYKDKGYTETSLIGKTGAEKVYEEKLRASDGYAIVILDKNRSTITTVAKKDKKDGENVKLTIDINVQSTLYDELVNDAGCATAMDPHTGEVLALVSTPSYNPNELAYGITSARWEEITSNELNPLQSRFANVFTPGSTFKAITGAIGLETGQISNDTDLGKAENWLWQLDDSWGEYFIPTQTQYSEPSTLVNALKYSDNIYFAKLATQIGSKEYEEGLDTFGFNETLPFDFHLAKSTYGKKLSDDVTLATTGFGQGQLQVNPLHLTAMYSTFLNEGNMLQPTLLYEEGKVSYYKKEVITKEHAEIMKNDLIATAQHVAPVLNQNIGGKTGTAEVGEEQLGWMVAFREEGTRSMLVSVMVENAKAKNGSVYVIPMIQDIFTKIQ
ncbi:MAG: penicillin-binding transpeptidase domain-containing protein [Erysipelotrichia bacterium]|nr:penicillin-binding transpeptidase domain-containing protein [Erysipelotrichia bacterium]NCC54730.1 penicillin-binding transpeptidase domain-containing protein [Erysipelotrichia bacterium]